jgi:hypothetical protein
VRGFLALVISCRSNPHLPPLPEKGEATRAHAIHLFEAKTCRECPDGARRSRNCFASAACVKSDIPDQATAEIPIIPDHELLRVIGRGAYGEIWLARTVIGAFRAVKVVYRSTFESERAFLREFEGMSAFEPISRPRRLYRHPACRTNRGLSLLQYGVGGRSFGRAQDRYWQLRTAHVKDGS